MEFRRGVSKLNAHIRPLVKRTSEDDSETVRLVVTQRTDDKWGDASRGTSPTDTQGLSVELCQNKKTDTHYSSSMRFFLMSFERGGQSGDCLGGSPL